MSAARIERSARPNKDCWWVKVEGTAGFCVWLSPRMSGEVASGFRFVCVMFHDPKAQSPMATFTGVAALDRGGSVGASNGSVKIRVSPKSGLTWGAVERAEQLHVERVKAGR